ncbi:P-loop containing nucleoside triphosphate hydrolase protein [Peziza echinospora]|nr:P-loop containing nucleoside triphosphate hydrolase protein [Peziza echinospora]
MPPPPQPQPQQTTASTPQIHSTSQQTRFHLPTDSSSSSSGSREIDLTDLTLAIAGRDEAILEDAKLRLRGGGVRYVLVGRNGVGKSTLLRALGGGLVPGVQGGVRMVMLGQVEEGGGGRSADDGEVVGVVVRSDKVLEGVRRRWEEADCNFWVVALHKALERSEDPLEAVKVLRGFRVEDQVRAVEEKAKEAKLRSGARGMKARKELKKVEEEHVALVEKMADFSEQSVVAGEINEAHALLAELEGALEGMSASSAEARATTLLKGLGFSDVTLTKQFSSLSSGWKMRTHLASCLFQQCDILLLDEPTNFLDLPALLWLESYLTSDARINPPTLVLVTHDQSFADAVAEEILVLRDKKIEAFPGTLTAYKLVRKEQRARLLKMKDAQDKQKTHIEGTISNSIRAAKQSGDDKRLKQAVSRQKKLDDRMGMQVNANGGRFKLNRDLAGYHFSKRPDIVVPPDEEEEAGRFDIPLEPQELRFPGPLVHCEKLTFTYKGAKSPVLKDVGLTIHLHDRIGIMGLNGAGKSTFVSLLLNHPDVLASGTVARGAVVTHHPKLHIAHFSQTLVDSLPPAQTALGYLLALPGLSTPFTEQTARAALASVSLRGKTVSHVPIAQLSGGQKVRLALVAVLFPPPAPPQLLVLDEVTTHLDAESICALARGLGRFRGAVVVVSHDRWFVREVVEGGGEGGDEDGEDGEGEAGGRAVKGVREVYVVQDAGVKRVKGGVEMFERRIRKRFGIV